MSVPNRWKQRELGRALAAVLESARLPAADRVQCLFALVFAEARKQGFSKEQIAEWAVRAFDTFAAAEPPTNPPAA